MLFSWTWVTIQILKNLDEDVFNFEMNESVVQIAMIDKSMAMKLMAIVGLAKTGDHHRQAHLRFSHFVWCQQTVSAYRNRQASVLIHRKLLMALDVRRSGGRGHISRT